MHKETPQIRFKGFLNSWSKSSIGEGTKKIGDGLHGTPKYTDEGSVVFINGNNLKNGKIIINEHTKKVTEEQQSKHDKELNVNTILMSINGTIGNLAFYNEERLMLGKSAAFIEVDKFNKIFLYNLLQTEKIKKHFLSNLTGTTIKNLGLKTIRKTPCYVPHEDEQIKIGNFFKQMDENIQLNQHAQHLLKQRKKVFLQKMFPNEKKKYPEIRFSGYFDEWEKKELGQYVNIKTGNSDLQDSDPNGIYPFFVRSNNIEKSNRYIFEGEAILIPGEGRLGDIYHYVNGKFDYHQRVYKISDFENVDAKFVLYFMQKNFKRHAMKYTVKATVDSLRLPMIEEFPIILPSLEEQKKIGTFFKELDNSIILQEEKIESLKLMKKAFLQKMFV